MSPASEKGSAQLVQSLVKQIVQAVDEKDFSKADNLREELILKEPTALSEIIKTDSIIEEAKTAALDKEHLATWHKLYENLSEEEVNCLFYSMKKVVVPARKRILAHGGMNKKLFFIDKGQVTVYLPKEEKNIVIAQLGRGDLLGEYTFATISLCSASVVSSTDVELRYLENDVALSWFDKQPVLYEKIIQFCNEHGRIEQILRSKKLEKRTNRRFSAKGLITGVLLTGEGTRTDSVIKGVLSDISLSGCCFDTRISKQETARAMLAKHFHFTMKREISGKQVQRQMAGKVVKVSSHLHGDYSLHVRFIKLIDEEWLKPFVIS